VSRRLFPQVVVLSSVRPSSREDFVVASLPYYSSARRSSLLARREAAASQLHSYSTYSRSQEASKEAAERCHTEHVLYCTDELGQLPSLPVSSWLFIFVQYYNKRSGAATQRRLVPVLDSSTELPPEVASLSEATRSTLACAHAVASARSTADRKRTS